jgi:hypothetical protein
MPKKFTKKDLISFGEYLLSKERKRTFDKRYEEIPLKYRLRMVWNRDFKNWKNG